MGGCESGGKSDREMNFRGRREEERKRGSRYTLAPTFPPPSSQAVKPHISQRSDLLGHTLSLWYFSLCPMPFFGRLVECWSHDFFSERGPREGRGGDLLPVGRR